MPSIQIRNRVRETAAAIAGHHAKFAAEKKIKESIATTVRHGHKCPTICMLLSSIQTLVATAALC